MDKLEKIQKQLLLTNVLKAVLSGDKIVLRADQKETLQEIIN